MDQTGSGGFYQVAIINLIHTLMLGDHTPLANEVQQVRTHPVRVMAELGQIAHECFSLVKARDPSRTAFILAAFKPVKNRRPDKMIR
jgi:hypothetical protein